MIYVYGRRASQCAGEVRVGFARARAGLGQMDGCCCIYFLWNRIPLSLRIAKSIELSFSYAFLHPLFVGVVDNREEVYSVSDVGIDIIDLIPDFSSFKTRREI